MDRLSDKLAGKIKGVLEGFDRIVFKGILQPLCFEAGMRMFLSKHGVLNKNYKEWMLGASTAIVREAEEYCLRQTGTGIQYPASCHTRKEEQAHERQKKLGIHTGLIGAWSCVE